MTSNIPIILSYWQDRHKEIIGYPYLTLYGKDTALLKMILNTYGVEMTRKLIDAFFGDIMTDAFLQKCGASIGIFKTQIPKLLIRVHDMKQTKADEQKGKV